MNLAHPTPKAPCPTWVAARAAHASGRSGGNAQKVFVALSATAPLRYVGILPSVFVGTV